MHNKYFFSIFEETKMIFSMQPIETIDFHIKLLWHSLANMYNKIAQEYDLTQASGFVLLHIDSKNGTPATKIAPLMGMKATSLSRMLKKMEDDFLICRKKDDKDGRMVNIHLTDIGIEKKKIAKRVVKEFNQYLIDKLDTKELEHYFKSIKSITRLTEEYKLEKNLEG